VLQAVELRSHERLGSELKTLFIPIDMLRCEMTVPGACRPVSPVSAESRLCTAEACVTHQLIVQEVWIRCRTRRQGSANLGIRKLHVEARWRRRRTMSILQIEHQL
jgi:hypothetical protein